MTAHVPLIVPREAEKCRMDVDGHTIVWAPGQPIVFDDTYPHEVWNDTDETRVVLLIQFRRPMRQPGRIVADAIVTFIRKSSFVQRARRNLPYWEKAYAQAESGPGAGA
jgi:aspartyl/asparaginyl beta-hydroxylase (cupin superfamily)